MKPTLKRTMHLTAICAMVFIAVIVTKNTVKNIRCLYGNESMTNNGINSFFDVIY
ncbi:MAG: hypothetical protein V4580_08525 [Bacteroidota bacterium]